MDSMHSNISNPLRLYRAKMWFDRVVCRLLLCGPVR